MMRILTSTLLLAISMVGGTLVAQEYSASSSQRENLGAQLAFDGQNDTRWSAEFKSKTGWLQVCVSSAQTVASPCSPASYGAGSA